MKYLALTNQNNIIMKTRTLSLLTLLLLSSLMMLGQEKKKVKSKIPSVTNCFECDSVYTIVYDFECKQFYTLVEGAYTLIKDIDQFKISHNEALQFKIANVNKYIYDIQLSIDDIHFTSEAPELFKQLFLGQGSYLNGLIALLSSGPQESALSPESDSLQGLEIFELAEPVHLEEFRDSLLSWMRTYNAMVEGQLEYFQFCTKKSKCCNPFSMLSFASISEKLLKLNEMKGHVDGELLEVSTNAQNEILRIQEELKSQLKRRDLFLVELDKEKNQVARTKIEAKIEELNCDGLANEIVAHQAVKSHYDAVKSEMEKLSTLVLKLSEEDLMKLVLFVNNGVADHYQYTSPTFYPDGDRLNIGLKICPRKENNKALATMPLANDSLNLGLFIKKKWSVSFGVGPFIGLSKSLRNDKYEWQAEPNSDGVVTDTSYYHLVSSGRSNLPLGLGAIVSISSRLSRGFGIGFTTGVGIEIAKTPRPAYLLGGSLLFGETNQLCINGGLALMPVDRINRAKYADSASYFKTEAIDYNTTLALGCFISVSFNILSAEKSNTIKTFK